MIIDRILYKIVLFFLITMVINVNCKVYWNKIVNSCLNKSNEINNKSISVFMMIKDRSSYVETLKYYIDILYHNSIQLEEEPELILFDFNSKIPVEIPWPYNNKNLYSKIKLIRFDCLINCNSKKETCEYCSYPYSYFNYWVGFVLSICHLKYDRIMYFENDLYPDKYFHLYNYIGPQSWTFRASNKYYTCSFSTSRRQLIQFLFQLPDFLIEKSDLSLSSDQVLIYYMNFSRSEEFLRHVEHIGGMKDSESTKPHVRVQWRLYLYLQRYGDTAGGNILNGGIGGNNQRYFCDDKQITCNLIFRKLTSLWGIYHIIDILLRFEIFWTLIFNIFNYSKTIFHYILILLFILFLFHFKRFKKFRTIYMLIIRRIIKR